MPDVLSEIDQYRPKSNSLTSRWAAVHPPQWTRELSFSTMDNTWEHRGWLNTWAGEFSPRGVVLVGPPGTGKTGLMCAVLRKCAEQGLGSPGWWGLVTNPRLMRNVEARQTPVQEAPVWFERWMDLRARLLRRPEVETLESYKSHEEIMEDIASHVELLGLDDIDTDRFTPWKQEVLMLLVERPMNGKQIILTTNVECEDWLEYFGEKVADRLMDRGYFALLSVNCTSRRQR